MKTVFVFVIKKQRHLTKLWKRNWRMFNKDGLQDELGKEDWNIDSKKNPEQCHRPRASTGGLCGGT